MPAVAQISVDFARRSEIQSSPTVPPTNVKSVSPYTLAGYMLYNRELPPADNFGQALPSNLSYDGGFITAGNRINVKHNDLQLRQNLEVGRYVQTEFIISRTKENNDSYQSIRQNNTRSVTITPRVEDINTSSINNVFCSIGAEPSRNFVDIVTKRSADESSIKINNTSGDVTITLRTNKYTLIAPIIQVTGTTNHTGDVTISGQTTINNTVNIKDNLNLGTSSFNKFNVVASSGNVSFTGDLNINTNRFFVDSSTGNTAISGDVITGKNVTIKNETFMENKLNFTIGSPNSDNRRIRGLRKTINFSDIVNTSNESDALNIGDFVERYYNIPKVNGNSNYTVTDLNTGDSQTTILCNNTSNIDIILPSNLRVGTQVSFIRMNTGNVTFVAGTGSTIKSAPTDSFKKLAFISSVASCYFAGDIGGQKRWYVFGDLLP